ncbi:MAG: hypothetical protein NZ519_12505 [Bacteroidia bacterium]|nr:hypothetical protein [Bacteroidia bacterium]MDW8347836.1 hypothetical protein [Bacteroidia bacterium]
MSKIVEILVIESFTSTPHLETAGEIAIREARKGKITAFSYIDCDNPDCEIPLTLRNVLLGASNRHKFEQIARILSQQNIHIIKPVKLSKNTIKEIRLFTLSQFDNLEELKKLTYKNARLGLGIASSLISRIKDPYVDVNLYRSLLRRYMRASAFTYEVAYQIIKHYNPTTVITFNNRFACSKPISEVCKHLKIPLIIHERGADYRRFSLYSQSCHNFAYIRQLIRESWQKGGQDRKIVAQSFFERKRMGDGISWKSFTDAQEKGNFPKRRLQRRLVYFSSSDDEFASIDDDMIEQSLFKSQRDAIIFLIKWVSSQPDTELVIRVHPHLREKSKKERDWWDNLTGANVLTIKADSSVDSYALADSADVVLSYGSTMGIEAAYFGKPSILLGDSNYRGFGCTYEPNSLSELIELIENKNLPSLPSENALPYGFYFMTHGELYKYYEPTSLFSGLFMGIELSYYKGWIRWLKRTIINKSNNLAKVLTRY